LSEVFLHGGQLHTERPVPEKEELAIDKTCNTKMLLLFLQKKEKSPKPIAQKPTEPQKNKSKEQTKKAEKQRSEAQISASLCY
jgi:hypothetical protein